MHMVDNRIRMKLRPSGSWLLPFTAKEAASAVCKDTWVSAGDLSKIQAAALKDMLAACRYPRPRGRGARAAHGGRIRDQAA